MGWRKVDGGSRRDLLASMMVAVGAVISLIVCLFCALAVKSPDDASQPVTAREHLTAHEPPSEPTWVTLPNGEEVLNDGFVVTSVEGLIDLAHASCAADLDVGECERFEVRIVDFFEPQIGEVDLWVGVGPEGRIEAEAILLDPSLVGMQTSYVEHVIAHEWNHVEQIEGLETYARYRTLERHADAYFSPRARPGASLDGHELLTDCMTMFQDGRRSMFTGSAVTPYVEEMLTSTTMEQACGDGWRALLPALRR